MGAESMEGKLVLIHDLETFSKANDEADRKAGRIPGQPDDDGFRRPRCPWHPQAAPSARYGNGDVLNTGNRYDPLLEKMDTQPPDQSDVGISQQQSKSGNNRQSQPQQQPHPQQQTHQGQYVQQNGLSQAQQPHFTSTGLNQQEQSQQGATYYHQAGFNAPGQPDNRPSKPNQLPNHSPRAQQRQENSYAEHQRQATPSQSISTNPTNPYQQPPGYEKVQRSVYHSNGPNRGANRNGTPSGRVRGRGMTIFDRRQTRQTDNVKPYDNSGNRPGVTPRRSDYRNHHSGYEQVSRYSSASRYPDNVHSQTPSQNTGGHMRPDMGHVSHFGGASHTPQDRRAQNNERNVWFPDREKVQQGVSLHTLPHTPKGWNDEKSYPMIPRSVSHPSSVAGRMPGDLPGLKPLTGNHNPNGGRGVGEFEKPQGFGRIGGDSVSSGGFRFSAGSVQEGHQHQQQQLLASRTDTTGNRESGQGLLHSQKPRYQFHY